MLLAPQGNQFAAQFFVLLVEECQPIGQHPNQVCSRFGMLLRLKYPPLNVLFVEHRKSSAVARLKIRAYQYKRFGTTIGRVKGENRYVVLGFSQSPDPGSFA